MLVLACAHAGVDAPGRWWVAHGDPVRLEVLGEQVRWCFWPCPVLVHALGMHERQYGALVEALAPVAQAHEVHCMWPLFWHAWRWWGFMAPALARLEDLAHSLGLL